MSNTNTKDFELKNVSADVFKIIEQNTNSELNVNFGGFLSENEQIASCFMSTNGAKLFGEESTKIEVPENIKFSKILIAAYIDGAKSFCLKQELLEAQKVLNNVLSQKKTEAVIDFGKFGYDHATVATIIAFLKTKGWHVNWQELDHSFSSIHEDWVCKFKKGKAITVEELITPTIMKLSTEIAKLNRMEIWDLENEKGLFF